MVETLTLDQHEGVQTIALNRPSRLNALSTDLLRELNDVLRATEQDDAVRVVVLTGRGRAFCSGADLAEFGPPSEAVSWPPALGDLLRTRINPVILRLRSIEKPVLAAVNGVAAGAGMSLALACDLRDAAESSQFIQAFANIGLVPDAGSFYFLPRLVGASKALELAWTAQPVPAREALELGLVNRVVPDASLMDSTLELAARLARGPARAIGLTKRGMNQAHELGLARVLEMEAGYQTIAARTSDFAEGVAAFLEKRPARFTGA